jgi:hypothetical protein
MTMPNRLNDHAVVATDTSMLIAGGWTYTSYPNGDPRSEVEIWVDPTTGIHEVKSQQSAVSCYPNPTAGPTEFQISIFEFQQVSLKVYNTQGQEVATVLDEVLPAGKHTVKWDAGGLQAGIYFYRLTTDDYRLTTGKLVKY